MRGGNLGAHARGAVRHDRIEEPNHINALLEHAAGEFLRQRGVAQHDRNNGMRSRLDR
jgi:hypothetical protein